MFVISKTKRKDFVNILLETYDDDATTDKKPTENLASLSYEKKMTFEVSFFDADLSVSRYWSKV